MKNRISKFPETWGIQKRKQIRVGTRLAYQYKNVHVRKFEMNPESEMELVTITDFQNRYNYIDYSLISFSLISVGTSQTFRSKLFPPHPSEKLPSIYSTVVNPISFDAGIRKLTKILSRLGFL